MKFETKIVAPCGLWELKVMPDPKGDPSLSENNIRGINRKFME